MNKTEHKTAKTDGIQDRAEFYQGRLPNCQFLGAYLMALKLVPDFPHNIWTKHQDGRYTVQFPGAPENPIHVKAEEYAPQQWTQTIRPTQVKGSEEIRVLEVAYAKLLKTLYPERFKSINTRFIRALFHNPNFDPEFFTSPFALEMLTGIKSQRYMKSDSKLISRIKEVLGKRRNRIQITDKDCVTKDYAKQVDLALKRFAKEPERYAIAFVSNPIGNRTPIINGKKSPRIDWGLKLPAYHVLVVDKVDLANQQVTIKDPHNTRYSLVLPTEDMLESFFKLYVAEKPKASPK